MAFSFGSIMGALKGAGQSLGKAFGGANGGMSARQAFKGASMADKLGMLGQAFGGDTAGLLQTIRGQGGGGGADSVGVDWAGAPVIPDSGYDWAGGGPDDAPLDQVNLGPLTRPMFGRRGLGFGRGG